MRKIVTIALLLFVSSAARSQSAAAPGALELRDIKGHWLRLDDYKGRVLLINFWATWCPPCRQEIPDLIKLQRLYRRQGLQIIGITYPPQNLAEVKRFARRLGMNYPVAIGTKESRKLFTSSETLPVTVVLDRDGAVRDTIEGIMYPDEFEQKVKPLFQPVQPAPLSNISIEVELKSVIYRWH